VAMGHANTPRRPTLVQTAARCWFKRIRFVEHIFDSGCLDPLDYGSNCFHGLPNLAGAG